MEIKQAILQIYQDSFKTYGYRRISLVLWDQFKLHVSDTKLRELMAEVGINNTLYTTHTTKKYSSYEGDKKTTPNILKGRFIATIPYTVLHTDITQVKLKNG
ncbi:IS3 family transposase, partial [Secundilactobacillus folii]